MQILKKRSVSFRPTSSVKAMLAEIENLIFILNKNISLEDVINSILQQYLPILMLNLKNELYSKEKFEKLLNEIENKIQNNQILQKKEITEIDEINDNDENNNDEIIENFNSNNIKNKLIF